MVGGDRSNARNRFAVATALGAGLVHDLRNALAVAESSAFIAKRKLDSPAEALVHIEKIEREVRTAQMLVTRVLGYLRGDPLPLARTPVAPLVDGVLQSFRVSPHLTVVRAIHPAELSLFVEPVLLKMLVENLVRNAFEALEGRASGTVTIGVSRSDAGGELTVDDDGPGLPAELRDPFAGLVSSKPHGTGLGLVMVEAVAHAHDGEVEAFRLPQGTRIRVTLPQA